jgi:hypothetical protein
MQEGVLPRVYKRRFRVKKPFFHHKNKSYRISLEAEEITEPKTKKDGAE